MKSWMTVAGVVLFWVVGCATPVYLNLPPQPRDVAINNPDHPVALSIQTAAIRHVLAAYAPPGPYGVVLPEGSSEKSYEQVLAGLPEGGEQAVKVGGTIYRVAHVQIRGLRGQVDVVGPAGGHVERLISVYLEPAGRSNWKVQRARVWQIDANQAQQISLPAPQVVNPSDAAAPHKLEKAGSEAPNLKDDLKE